MTNLPRITILLIVFNAILLGCYLVGARTGQAQATVAQEDPFTTP